MLISETYSAVLLTEKIHLETNVSAAVSVWLSGIDVMSDLWLAIVFVHVVSSWNPGCLSKGGPQGNSG